MKRVLIGIGGVLALGVLGFAVAASTQPDTTHVERSATVAAAPADVFPYINDFSRWDKWSPWHDLDPNQKVAVSENPAGVGAWYTWEGNDDVGKGKMTIEESVPPERLVEDLAFLEPFESRALITFTLTPEGAGTKVTWAYDAENPFMSKVFGMMVDMDAMLGADFEKGLARMKPLAEADAVARVEAERVAAEAAAQAAATAVDPMAAPPARP